MPEKHHLYTALQANPSPWIQTYRDADADVRLVVGGDSVANSYPGSQRLFITTP